MSAGRSRPPCHLAADLRDLLGVTLLKCRTIALGLSVLVAGERCDDVHGGALAERLKLVDVLEAQVGLLELDHEELYRSDGHCRPPSLMLNWAGMSCAAP